MVLPYPPRIHERLPANNSFPVLLPRPVAPFYRADTQPLIGPFRPADFTRTTLMGGFGEDGPPKQQREDDWSSHPMYRRGKTVFRINKSGITSVTLAAVASQRRFTVMNGFRLGAGSGTRLHWPQARTGWNFATSLWSFPLMALWIFPNDLMEVMRWKVAAFGSLILFDTKTIKFTN